MKKYTVILYLILYISNVYSQKNSSTLQDYKLNDIEVSTTYLVLPFVSNKNSIPSVSLSYYYQINKWFWIGTVLNFNNVTSNQEVFDYNGNEQEKNYNCFGFAPTVRFSYVNKSNFLLYSALAMGLETIYQERKWSMATVPYFQGTLIGISYGKNLYLGGELGAGFKGILNVNVGYRF